MVSAATEAKQGTALLDLYVSLWEHKYGSKPPINRYADKWGMIDVIKDLGKKRAEEVLHFYFEHGNYPSHPLKSFLYNYDKLDKAQKEAVADDARRAALRAQTKARVEEWRADLEHRSTSD